MSATAMRPFLRVFMAAAIGFVAVADSRAADDAQPAPPATGAWRIETTPGQDGQENSYAAVASAIDDGDAQLSLTCRRDPDHYAFAVKMSGLPADGTVGEATVMVETGSRDLARFTTMTRDGRAVIQERVHQTAFTIVFGTLSQSDAATADISIDERKRVFPLTGFNAAVEVLADRCGFEPDPTRGGGARGGGSRRSAPPPMVPRPR